MGTTVVIVITAVIVVSVFAMLISLRMNVAQAAKRSRLERRQLQQKSPVWADAVVMESNRSTAGNASQVRVALTLNVSSTEGNPFQVKAEWLVDAAALHLLSPGSHVPVKVSPDGHQVFPAATWASPVAIS